MRLTGPFSASVGLALMGPLMVSMAALAEYAVRIAVLPARTGAAIPVVLLGLVLIATGAALVLDSRRRSAEEGSPVRVRRQRRA